MLTELKFTDLTYDTEIISGVQDLLDILPFLKIVY